MHLPCVCRFFCLFLSFQVLDGVDRPTEKCVNGPRVTNMIHRLVSVSLVGRFGGGGGGEPGCWVQAGCWCKLGVGESPKGVVVNVFVLEGRRKIGHAPSASRRNRRALHAWAERKVVEKQTLAFKFGPQPRV